VIRADHLVVSRPAYAFDPATFEMTNHGWPRVRAAWFKRKNGRLVATLGVYSPMCLRSARGSARDSYAAWIKAADDNRYGGSHLASWDGAALLNSDQPVSPAIAAERLAFLDAMLRGFPEPPAGFDGWWTFPRGRA
jgi:hypothetical protein